MNESRGSKDEGRFLACPEFVEGKHTIRSTLYAKLYDIRNTRYDIRTSIQNTVGSHGDFSGIHLISNFPYCIICTELWMVHSSLFIDNRQQKSDFR